MTKLSKNIQKINRDNITVLTTVSFAFNIFLILNFIN